MNDELVDILSNNYKNKRLPNVYYPLIVMSMHEYAFQHHN